MTPPRVAPEKEMLVAMLDQQRDVMLWKIEGLDDERLRKATTPSSMTLLGTLKHLAMVERWWFQDVFAGEDVTFPWTEDDPDADWRIEPAETTDDLVALYRQEIEKARVIIDAHDLDGLAARRVRDEDRSLRWVILHMIEETARHVGHADILREAADGSTGYLREET